MYLLRDELLTFSPGINWLDDMDEDYEIEWD